MLCYIIVNVEHLATEIAKKIFLKTFKKFLKRVKNTRRFAIVGVIIKFKETV